MADDISTTVDIVTVGGGVHGASLAYHLARKKAGRVLLLEKQFLASGPTARSTALVRRWSGQDFLTRVGSQAMAIFQNWHEIIGGDCGFRPVGFIALSGETGAATLRQTVARTQTLGARVELIGPNPLKELVPEMAVDDVALASYESESGYVDPFLTTSVLASRARDLGATIGQRTTVTTRARIRARSSATRNGSRGASRSCKTGSPEVATPASTTSRPTTSRCSAR